MQQSYDGDVADEALETIPLPSPLADASSDVATTPVTLGALEAMAAVEPNESQPATSSGFTLDKSQSLWLLNVVSFLYGTNTTCALSHLLTAVTAHRLPELHLRARQPLRTLKR
jgi:hypothetical protein